jgi:excisionase family DNA binding protein
MSPYLTVKETAEFLRLDEQTIRNKMHRGVFRPGVHYFVRRGEIGPRFKRAALEQWLEGRETAKKPPGQVIRMARGYDLGG